MGEKKVKLTPKQERFVQSYLQHFNASKAAREAGYSEKAAAVTGSILLRNSKVQQRINDLRGDMAGGFNVSRERLAQELARIAYGDPRAIFDKEGRMLPPDQWPDEVAATISSVETEELFSGFGENRKQIGYTKKVKTWEKTKAIELLTRMMGYNEPDKIKGDIKNTHTIVKIVRKNNRTGTAGTSSGAGADLDDGDEI